MKIEKNLPIPSSVVGRPAIYPWADMEIGDSFLAMPDGGKTSLTSKLSTCAAHAFGKGNYATRKEGDGVRVWRTG